MIVLDTDHLSLLDYYRTNPRSQLLRQKLDAAAEQGIVVTVISLEEQMRGWLAAVQHCRTMRDQVNPYQKMAKFSRIL